MNDKQLEHLLNDDLEALERELSPHNDLWPGIDQAINSSRFHVNRSFALAASLVLAVGIVFSSGLYFRNSADSTTDLSELITLLQTTHERNIQFLLVEYQDHEALAQDWDIQMEQLEQAQQVIYEALKDDPGNLELLKILRQVQEKQINLIDSVFAPTFNTV